MSSSAYYDSEAADKNASVTEQHQKFYEDLKLRRSNGDEIYQDYVQKFEQLKNIFAEKISTHTTKFDNIL